METDLSLEVNNNSMHYSDSTAEDVGDTELEVVREVDRLIVLKEKRLIIEFC